MRNGRLTDGTQKEAAAKAKKEEKKMKGVSALLEAATILEERERAKEGVAGLLAAAAALEEREKGVDALLAAADILAEREKKKIEETNLSLLLGAALASDMEEIEKKLEQL